MAKTPPIKVIEPEDSFYKIATQRIRRSSTNQKAQDYTATHNRVDTGGYFTSAAVSIKEGLKDEAPADDIKLEDKQGSSLVRTFKRSTASSLLDLIKSILAGKKVNVNDAIKQMFKLMIDQGNLVVDLIDSIIKEDGHFGITEKLPENEFGIRKENELLLYKDIPEKKVKVYQYKNETSGEGTEVHVYSEEDKNPIVIRFGNEGPWIRYHGPLNNELTSPKPGLGNISSRSNLQLRLHAAA